MSTVVRKAVHAGSWYESNPAKLGVELDGYLHEGKVATTVGLVKAIIAPHAGYRYSGRTAGRCYARINAKESVTSRVYVLGPLHHLSSTKALLSLCSAVATPWGEIPVDVEEQDLLRQECPHLFQHWPSIHDEEEEHSLEMQFPMLHRALVGSDGAARFKIVPIGIGHLSPSAQAEMGELIGKRIWVDDALLIISSDFCHWGSRFRYQYRLKSTVPIHESITMLDKQAMQLIVSQDLPGFRTYLKETRNTICGQQPISVLLAACNKHPCEIQFVHYEQSSACTSMDDSSVSYAAGIVTMQ